MDAFPFVSLPIMSWQGLAHPVIEREINATFECLQRCGRIGFDIFHRKLDIGCHNEGRIWVDNWTDIRALARTWES